MTTQSVVMTTTGYSDPIFLPGDSASWREVLASLLVNFSAGTIGLANVEVSNDANTKTTPLTSRWNLHDTLQSLGASKNGNLAASVLAVRLRVLSLASGGQISLDINLPNPGQH